MLSFLDKIDTYFGQYADLGKLMTRICVAGMMLPHGITKLPFFWGLGGAEATLVKSNLPAGLALCAYIGEIVAPLMILLGWRTRIGSLFVIVTMIFAIFLTSGANLFGLDNFGGFLGEKQLMYIFASLSILFLGAGKYSIDKR